MKVFWSLFTDKIHRDPFSTVVFYKKSFLSIRRNREVLKGKHEGVRSRYYMKGVMTTTGNRSERNRLPYNRLQNTPLRNLCDHIKPEPISRDY